MKDFDALFAQYQAWNSMQFEMEPLYENFLRLRLEVNSPVQMFQDLQ